ncbi:hypothetical protein GCM10010399_85920 [Dactylosporangium fulvum]
MQAGAEVVYGHAAPVAHEAEVGTVRDVQHRHVQLLRRLPALSSSSSGLMAAIPRKRDNPTTNPGSGASILQLWCLTNPDVAEVSRHHNYKINVGGSR